MTNSRDDARLSFLDGGGRMGALMRSYDWSRTLLGHPAQWPETLKTAVATCLSSRFPMVIWWGPQLLMLYNDAWQPILGDTKHPAGLGRPGAESWPETWPVVGVQFEDALKGTASWSEDLLLASDRHGFLEESYFTYSHSPLRDAAGVVVGVLSVVSETTSRVLNERRLRTLGNLSSATIDATRRLESLEDLCRLLIDTICHGNPDVPFAVQYLVETAERAERVAVAGIDAALFPRTVDNTDRDAWGIAEALRRRSHVALKRSPSEGLPGGVWPEPATEVLSVPLFGSGAEICGILLVGINSRLRLDEAYVDFLSLAAAQFGSAISALQFVQRERAARANAQREARLRDEFLATLSHELRSPLNAVVGWTQILKSGITDPGKITTAVEVIERNARLQGRLITDLLDISRAISGNLTLEFQDVDLERVIGAAIESVTPAATAKNITITTQIEPANISVHGDPARLEQILWNLLTNALKFTPAGGRVDIVTVTDGKYARMRISDNGEGIDPEFLPHLFERFRQADGSASRRHQGLGLGLAIVKQFAELHGGRVSATSEGQGRGATFILELPLTSEESQRARMAPHTPAARLSSSDVSLRGIRVLVVDDHPDALLVLERMLDGAGASVTTASRAEHALEILQSETFDVIISDIAMPGMDGYEFIDEIRRRGISVPAIASTAFALPIDVAKATAAGYHAHISKPIDGSMLIGTVSQFAALTRAKSGSDRPASRSRNA